MSVGKRIAEERKRLGLSQEAFAELVGVSFSSQRRYEKGEREPDTKYLEALRKAGIDASYVLSGIALEQRQRNALEHSMEDFGCAFASILKITDSQLIQASKAVNKRLEIPNADFERTKNYERWKNAVKDAFLHECRPLVENSEAIQELIKEKIDIQLVGTVLEQIEKLLPQYGQISPTKKASLVTMLCRAFTASGKIDQAMIDEAVKLAAS